MVDVKVGCWVGYRAPGVSVITSEKINATLNVAQVQGCAELVASPRSPPSNPRHYYAVVLSLRGLRCVDCATVARELYRCIPRGSIIAAAVACGRANVKAA